MFVAGGAGGFFAGVGTGAKPATRHNLRVPGSATRKGTPDQTRASLIRFGQAIFISTFCAEGKSVMDIGMDKIIVVTLTVAAVVLILIAQKAGGRSRKGPSNPV